MADRFRLAMDLHAEALGEEGLRHHECLIERRFRRCFGDDVDAQLAVANPIGPLDLIFADEAVGVLCNGSHCFPSTFSR
jgi:hypothetical protein